MFKLFTGLFVKLLSFREENKLLRCPAHLRQKLHECLIICCSLSIREYKTNGEFKPGRLCTILYKIFGCFSCMLKALEMLLNAYLINSNITQSTIHHQEFYIKMENIQISFFLCLCENPHVDVDIVIYKISESSIFVTIFNK